MANEDVSKLTEEMSGLRADFTRLAETLADLVRQRGQEAASKFQGSAQETWSDAKQTFDGVKQKIHDEPVTATVAAFGIGLLLGILLFGGRR
ncbi:MAG: hypothetical protein KGI68_08000 [Alphaproteobacteria bacterium]|nr:hypothetical protein [Alphaproteobacteria bacterium]MDE1986393.1 hypothetical protein [Alphaproteobacteria bacterium]MDE2162757.1 hypothetical protein [Alphaproteobacteria bacterium]MDE2266306.1 hypothetical protein [Alphaproteobacteria bacterium]MDE2498688.1 hypothetical protein [Alphaproteobacteria bacterium]